MANNIQIKRRERATDSAKSNVSTEVSKASIAFVAIFGVAVGLWSLACIIGGLAATGGPLNLVGAWFKAVTGM